jgi:hypothetical protein
MLLQHDQFGGNIASPSGARAADRVTRITAPEAFKVKRCPAGRGAWLGLRGTKPEDVHITLEG